MSKKNWMNVRSLRRDPKKLVEVLGSSDVTSCVLEVYKVVYNEELGCFNTKSGWVVTPFAWREI